MGSACPICLLPNSVHFLSPLSGWASGSRSSGSWRRGREGQRRASPSPRAPLSSHSGTLPLCSVLSLKDTQDSASYWLGQKWGTRCQSPNTWPATSMGARPLGVRSNNFERGQGQLSSKGHALWEGGLMVEGRPAGSSFFCCFRCCFTLGFIITGALVAASAKWGYEDHPYAATVRAR